MKNLLLNFCVLSFSITLILVTAEIAFRFNAYLDDNKILSEALKHPQEIPYDKKVSLGHIIRLSSNNRIIFELKPNLSVFFEGANVTTNNEGFRDKNYTIEKENNIIRIVGIGDSVMFGFGVPDGKDYLSLLENKLNDKYSQKKFEIINTAVPGYNTVQEVETLKEKGLEYRPDIVILGFITNDCALPVFIRDREDYFTLKKSFIKTLILQKINNIKNVKNPLIFVKNQAALGMPEVDSSKVPIQYRNMVGKSAFDKAMNELKEMSIKEGFTVIAIFLTQFRSNIAFHSQFASVFDLEAIKKSSELGFHNIVLEPSILKFMEKNRIREYLGSVLSISKNDAHPSAFTHELIAEMLMNDLTSQNILENYINQVEDKFREDNK